MKFRNLFWGIILIFIGTLAILNNFDVIDFAWRKLWNLWPVFLMLWGISILPIKDGIRLGLVVITLGLTMYYITSQAVYTGTNDMTAQSWSDQDWDDEDYDSNTSDYDSSSNANFLIPFSEGLETATLKFDAVAGDFVLNKSTKNLVTFNMAGSKMARYYKYSVKTQESDALININTKHHVNWKPNSKNDSKGTLRLNKKPVWTIDVKSGAAALNFNMEKFKVKKLTVDAGAADINVTIGDKYPDVNININAGASDITVRIPESAGCKVKMDTFLADKTLNGFNKINGRYITPNYDEAKNTIYIDIDSAVSSLTIERY